MNNPARLAVDHRPGGFPALPPENQIQIAMPILNYTTSISATKTVTEIQTMLANHKAQAVMSEYDDDGVLIALSFRIKTGCGVLSFRLPSNVQRVYQVLVRQKVPRGLQTKEQASRVAWRIVKDWLAAQLALVSAEMVEIEQVFLPYAQDNSGVTLYENLRDRQFAGLALPFSSVQ
jgi:hypothetical protein